MTRYLALYTGPGGPLSLLRERIDGWPLSEIEADTCKQMKACGDWLQSYDAATLERLGYQLVCRLENDALYECPVRVGAECG